jgi:DNA-binding NarL/FixJ family response regulator
MTDILIVGDVRLYRDGIAYVLSRTQGFQVVGSAGDAAEGLAQARDLLPDIVLLDLSMSCSRELAQEISRAQPQTRVVALGVTEEEEEVVACAEAGVVGYVAREGSVDALVAALESVARGELLCSPRMAGTLLRRLGRIGAERALGHSTADLTVRERQILLLIDQGLSNKEIAGRLGIELATVKNHVHNLLEKLGVHRRSDAARLMQPGRERRMRWEARRS